MIVFFAGCSPEKNTSSTRAYHNLTSHYNIYFNGEQSFIKGVEKIDNSFQNNYSQILSVFNYVDADLASQVKPQMDRAIRKATKVITLHSIKVKPDCFVIFIVLGINQSYDVWGIVTLVMMIATMGIMYFQFEKGKITSIVLYGIAHRLTRSTSKL